MTISELVTKQREYFQTGATKELPFRLAQLRALRKAIEYSERSVADALKADLNKSYFEAFTTEIGIVLHEISYAEKHLRSWMKPQKVKTPLASFPGSSRVYREPYGVALIMAPWNYPFQLALTPLVGAIAAGNCAVVKPGSYAPETANCISKIIESCFDRSYVSVVLGGRDANTDLLDQKFDSIFFTGGTRVGKAVMSAAAKNLTPVCLELGGKSPCIVDETADLRVAAKRIAWGKCVNAGQTCIAPDFLYVQKSVKDELLRLIAEQFTAFFGDNPRDDPQYPKMINRGHFDRVCELMDSGGDIVCGGARNAEMLTIDPTVIDVARWDMPLLCEEIFGPVLPVITFESLAEAAAVLAKKPKPLALYLFTASKENEAFVMKNISFGGGCINETLMHLVTPYMPFGGVGDSGMGGYHGRSSFEAFSHRKSVLKKYKPETPIRYAPYQEKMMKYVRMLMK